MSKQEGHYTIKRVKRLPKRGNANWLYLLEDTPITTLHLWQNNGLYKELPIGGSVTGGASITLVAGKNISIDMTDPLKPIINNTQDIQTVKGDKGDKGDNGVDGNNASVDIQAGTGISVNNTDVTKPIITNTQDISGIATNATAITALDDIQNIQNSLIDLNTDKVSADGSVTTHSDVTGAGSGEIITISERDKLAGLESSKFLGQYTTKTLLDAVHPNPLEGSYAYVDAGVGEEVSTYIWDSTDNVFVEQAGTSTAETPASVHTKYGLNPNTNHLTDALKTKLDNLSGVNTGDQDLSNYVTKDGFNIITGNNIFEGYNTFKGNIAIKVDDNPSNSGISIDIQGVKSGISINNELTAAAQKVFQGLTSTGSSYEVYKSFVSGTPYTEVFRIDNVGNTMLQELEIEQASENTVSDEVLVRGADNKVGFVSKASIGGAIIKDGNGYIIADRTDGAFHGNVGTGAFDLSYNTFLQSAVGDYASIKGKNNSGEGASDIAGERNTGGFGSRISGGNNTGDNYSNIAGNSNTGGAYSRVSGSHNIGGLYSDVTGLYTFAPSHGESAHGQWNTIYTPQSTTTFNINDRLFSLGNGTLNKRSNATEVWKDGRNILDKLIIRTLDNDATATKVLVADNTGKVGYQETSGYVPYSGATSDLDLGTTNDLKAGSLYSDNGVYMSVLRPNLLDFQRTTGASYIVSGNYLTLNGGGLGAGTGIGLDITDTLFKWKGNDVYHEGNQTINNWVVYGNSGATQTASANVPTVINNNGATLNNNGNITSLYNTSTQRVDLTQARVGDSLNITMEVEITTTTNNQVVYMTYNGATGSANSWTVNISNEINYKTQGTRRMVTSFKVPLEFVQDITNPANITITSDASLTFKAIYHSLTIN